MKEKAVVITGKEKAELQVVAGPGQPADDELLGRTLYTLVSPGTELACSYCGSNFPSFPGYAAVASVEATGRAVKSFRPGDTFFCSGRHAGFQKVKEADAVPVPSRLAPEQTVLCRLMGVSMTTLMTTAARPGDRVIVSGSGPVGFLAAQVFHLSGYNVSVVEPLKERRDVFDRIPGIAVFPRMPLDVAGITGETALVLESSGNEAAVLDACKIVRKRGEVVLVGVPWKRQTEISAHEVLSQVFSRYVVLRSGWEWELPVHGADFQPHSIFSAYRTALEWLAQGRIFTEGLIAPVKPEEAQSVYQALLRRKFRGLFPVFDWTHYARGRHRAR